MPSLRALEQFKASFLTLGSETETLAALELPLDDLSLPEHEPALPTEPALAEETSPRSQAEEAFPEAPGAGEDASETNFFTDLGDLLGGMNNSLQSGSQEIPEDWGSEQDDVDFGNFLDTIPDDFAPENKAETELPTESSEEPPELPPDEEDAEGLPPGLLDGFADEIEAERSVEDPFEEGVDEFPAFDSLDEGAADEAEFPALEEIPGADDFSAADTLGLPEDEFPVDEFPADEEALEAGAEESPIDSDESLSFDAADGEEAPDSLDSDGFDLENLPAFDSLDESAADEAEFPALEEIPEADDFSAADTLGLPGDEFPTEEFPGDEFPADEESLELGGEEIPVDSDESLSLDAADGEDEDADFSVDEDGFELDGEIQDTASLEEMPLDPLDSFDSFDPNTGALNDDFNIGEADDLGNLEEFSLPGFEDRLGAFPRAGDTNAAGQADKLPEAGDVEEINLSAGDLERLLVTLSSYPLNLRVACEELIAEQAVPPELMSRLIKLLVGGAPARETASLAGRILQKTIPIPKGFEKKTGAQLEAEQSSFAYIFVHNFLPVLRLFMMVGLVLLSAGYLCWRFIYTPLRAEKIYKLGIERIDAGEYSRANERFSEAYRIHQKKDWFYTYARAFRDARQYTLAEEKYQELLHFTASKSKRFIPEKAAVLEYADLETNYIGNYEEADTLIRRNILDYFPFDREALLALGDNSLAWGEYEPGRLEDARESYAKLMERYGRSDPLLERMLKYFIRTDNLPETLSLQSYFMASPNTSISAAALTELGGYLLDKRLEEVRGVPNAYLEQIGGIREILLRAIQQDRMLPESYYQLARYYNYFENEEEERLTLELAVQVFDAVEEENPKRIGYHIGALRRYAEILIGRQEFFPAEENLVKAANIYQDGISRRLLHPSPEFGKVYTALGDLEYFVKDGDMRSALDYYTLGEDSGWAPPEVRYRMGAASYQLRDWGDSLDRLFEVHREAPLNRRVLYALGNVSYMRGNYFAAQGYYERLLEILNEDRSRFPPIMPSDDEAQLDLAERLMVAQNNLGVTLEALTERTGDSGYRTQARGLYADSERAWDVLTRNPDTMMRMHPSPDINAPGVNPAYLNVQNSLHPAAAYEAQFFLRIDKDMLEPSAWEELAPPGYRLSEGIHTGR